jgi:hypothetical protein
MIKPATLPLRRRVGPALTLMFLAPLIAEVLPGATRVSALFVYPIEVCIWGGGALLIREAARRFDLGWLHMLFLALALALIEECIVQQTSFAPMVLQIFPGEPFARAFGVNYLYLLWALGYEATFVVFVPIILTELIFRSRRDEPWLRLPGVIAVAVIFIAACFPAWYLWTQIARTKVFNVPVYHPPGETVSIALFTIVLLVLFAIGPSRRRFFSNRRPAKPLVPWVIAAGGFVAAAVWYCLVLLAFGIRPSFPPAIPVMLGSAIVAVVVYLMPRFAAHPAWSDAHRIALVFGTTFGAMVVSFAGFIYGATPLDLYGKIALDVIATVLLSWLAVRLRRELFSGA